MDEELGRILARAFPGSSILAAEALQGGISARAVVVELSLPNAIQRRVVVRRPTRASQAEAQQVVRSEFEILGRCAALDIPAPRPCFLDLEAGAIVLEYIAGAPEFAPTNTDDMLNQMALQLTRIHTVALAGEAACLPSRTAKVAQHIRTEPSLLDATLEEARIRAALHALWPWQQHNADALLHGDYWPGNMLWRDGLLVAVIDWEEADIGDPLADLAISRLDILWAFGEAAMHTFTESYRQSSALDFRNLARWDLYVALRPMSNLARWSQSYALPPISRPDISEPFMRGGHRRFVQQALQAIERS